MAEIKWIEGNLFRITIPSRRKAEGQVTESLVESVCGHDFPGCLSRDQKLRLIKLLAQEGLSVEEDGISVIQSRGGILLLKIAVKKCRLFNRAVISYGVSHVGLPFPIIFSQMTDAVNFYCFELAARSQLLD